MAPLCHAAASGKKNNTGRGPKSGVALCHGVPPHHSCTCDIFRAVFDPDSLFFAPKPHGNPCYAGYRGPREQFHSVPRGGVKEKKMIGRRPRERCVCFPGRFGIDNALQDRKERKAKGDKERAESGSLCCFN